ncbi:MAG: reverse transcriptase domain-containing protein, partial [Candidatus Thiodiazotropha sp.]
IKYFVFNVLPFGIASAGHIFTKVLRVLVSYWRSQGHKVIMYLDDGIGGHSEYDKAWVLSQYLQKSLPEFGLLIASDKCHWEPVIRLEWLGYCLDMSVARVYVTEDRIGRLESAIDSLLYQIRASSLNVVKVRIVASVVGQVISLQTVLGKIVSLKTRALYHCILSRASWDAPVLVTQDAISELVFWRKKARFMNLNGRPIKENLEAEVELFCDASDEGYGGYFVANKVAACVGSESKCESVLSEKGMCLSIADLSDQSAECKGEDLVVQWATCDGMKAYDEASTGFSEVKSGVGSGGQVVVGSWSKQEMLKSSTWREAEAVKRILFSNLAVFEGKKLKIYSDNKNVKTILRSGSTKSDLQDIALKVYAFCDERDITLIPEWIPREKNARADFLSRCHDCDDWEVSNLVFRDLDNRWGPHTIDRFATNYNNKCIRFNSRWWVPEAEAVNAFDQDWSNDCNWMVPPPRLISLCFEKIENDQAAGTLIIPEWKSAPFWTKLIRDDCTFVPYITDFEFLPLKNTISKGKGNNGIFGKESVQFRMIALKIRFIK